jgi:hypothetical protein
MVVDAEFTAERVKTLREDAALNLENHCDYQETEPHTFLTPIAEAHYDAALALLEQARAQFMLASHWSSRGE